MGSKATNLLNKFKIDIKKNVKIPYGYNLTDLYTLLLICDRPQLQNLYDFLIKEKIVVDYFKYDYTSLFLAKDDCINLVINIHKGLPSSPKNIYMFDFNHYNNYYNGNNNDNNIQKLYSEVDSERFILLVKHKMITVTIDKIKQIYKNNFKDLCILAEYAPIDKYSEFIINTQFYLYIGKFLQRINELEKIDTKYYYNKYTHKPFINLLAINSIFDIVIKAILNNDFFLNNELNGFCDHNKKRNLFEIILNGCDYKSENFIKIINKLHQSNLFCNKCIAETNNTFLIAGTPVSENSILDIIIKHYNETHIDIYLNIRKSYISSYNCGLKNLNKKSANILIDYDINCDKITDDMKINHKKRSKTKALMMDKFTNKQIVPDIIYIIIEYLGTANMSEKTFKKLYL